MLPRGEVYYFQRGKAVAELRPVVAGNRLGELRSLFDSLPKLSGEEADSFSADVDALRREARSTGEKLRDPWES